MSAMVSEAEFTKSVISLATMLGYKPAHFRPAMNRRGQWATPVAGDGKGFPDLVLAGRGRIIFAELKTEKGKLSPEQQAWIDALRLTSAEVYVWRVGELQQIGELLMRGRPT